MDERFNWDDAAVERLRTMRAEGCTFSAIAVQLGCRSRSAVIGKAMRLGIAATKAQPGVAAPPKPKVQAKQVWRPAPAPVPVPVQPKARPAGRGVRLLDLAHHHCRWPIGDPRAPDFIFCGETVTEKPYCPRHTAMSKATRGEHA